MSFAALVLLALAGQAAEPSFRPEPARAEVGQPVRFVLALEHELGLRVSLAEQDPFAPPAGERAPALVADGPPTFEKRALADGRERTSWTWTARALEGGSFAPAQAALVVRDGRGERALLALAEPVSVAHALLESEDLPQPPTAFPEAPPQTVGLLFVGLAATAVLAALALVLFLLRRRRARARVPAPEASAEERLRAASERLLRPGETAAVARELVLVARGALDEALGTPRAALADEEWLAALEQEARLAPEERARARRLLSSLEGARYGGAEPTRFALEEALEHARELVWVARRIASEGAASEERGRREGKAA